MTDKIKTTNYYVTMTDKVMSGWGMARNLTNKLVFLCDTWDEASVVADNARQRGDQKHINVCVTRPAYFRTTQGKDYQHKQYYVQIKTKDDYPNWYKTNAFNPRNWEN